MSVKIVFKGKSSFASINIQHASVGFVCVEEDAHTSELKGYYNLIYMYMRGSLYSNVSPPLHACCLRACLHVCWLVFVVEPLHVTVHH